MLVNIGDTAVKPGGALHWGADVGEEGHQAAGCPAAAQAAGARGRC